MSEVTTVMSAHDSYGEASGEAHRLSGYFMIPNVKYSIRENSSGKYEVVKIESK